MLIYSAFMVIYSIDCGDGFYCQLRKTLYIYNTYSLFIGIAQQNQNNIYYLYLIMNLDIHIPDHTMVTMETNGKGSGLH